MIIYLVLIVSYSSAQNLVPNSSFEEFYTLPSEDGDFKLKEWKNVNSQANSESLTGKLGTPDYLSIDGFVDCKLPNSAKGWIKPKSGKAVVGIITYNHNIPNFREYIQVKLDESLIIGDKYIVSFAINTSVDNNTTNTYSDYYSSGIGVFLSEAELIQKTNEVIIKEPHGKIDYALDVSDSYNWKILSFILKADKQYNYLTIGNFDNDDETILKKKNRINQSSKMPIAYYFIDDVSILPFDQLLEENKNFEVKIDAPSVVCASNGPIFMEAIIREQNEGKIAEGTWSGGKGEFEHISENRFKYNFSKDEVGKEIIIEYSSLNKDIDISKTHKLSILPSIKIEGENMISTKYGNGVSLNAIYNSSKHNIGRYFWSGGKGIFTTDDNKETIYYPNISEIGKSIKLRLDYYGQQDLCNSHDVVTVRVIEERKIQDSIKNIDIQIEYDSIVCSNETKVSLKAFQTGNKNLTGTWSGGKGEFSNTESNHTSYEFHPSEMGSKVHLKFSLNSSKTINQKKIAIVYTNPLKVNAGKDIKLPYGEPFLLGAKMQHKLLDYYKLNWSGGDGFYTSDDQLETEYYPAISEIGGKVTLKLSIQDNLTGCTYSDNLSIRILPALKEKIVEVPSKSKDREPVQSSNLLDKKRILETKPKVGIVFKLETIRFEADSFNIKQDHFKELDLYKIYLNEHPKIQVEIGGHTNTIPMDDYCEELSDKRASSVMNYFIDNGINEDRLESNGYGKNKPIYKGKHASIQAKNQRVELKVIGIK